MGRGEGEKKESKWRRKARTFVGEVVEVEVEVGAEVRVRVKGEEKSS